MPLLNRDSVVAGQVQFVDLRLNYSNIGVDPAFGTELEFTIPEHFARQASVMFGDQVVSIQGFGRYEFNSTLVNVLLFLAWFFAFRIILCATPSAETILVTLITSFLLERYGLVTCS